MPAQQTSRLDVCLDKSILVHGSASRRASNGLLLADQALLLVGGHKSFQWGSVTVRCHASRISPAVLSFSSPSLQSASCPPALEGLHYSILLLGLFCMVLGQLPAHAGCAGPWISLLVLRRQRKWHRLKVIWPPESSMFTVQSAGKQC